MKAMKKIKQIKELRQEQQKLTRQEAELQTLIQCDWLEVKDAATLKNILKNRFKQEEDKKNEQKRAWINGLSYGAGLFARKMARLTENRIEARLNEKFESVMNKLSQRIRQQKNGRQVNN
jgi:hypothetical protein